MENFENADTVSNAGTSNVANLLKRAFMFLGEGKYSEADSYAEKVLDIDTENADAYLCKLLAELRLREPKELDRCAVDFSKSANYLKAHDFGDEKRQRVLEAYLKRAVAYAEVEEGKRIVAGLKDCQVTAKATESDINRKVKTGKVRGAIYIVAFVMLIAGAVLLGLSSSPVMEFTAAGPALLVSGVFLCYLMFIFVSKSYYEADSLGILVKLIIFMVTLFGGLGIWGLVLSIKLLKEKKMDSSTSDSFWATIKDAENHLKELEIKAETEDAALREFLERESF